MKKLSIVAMIICMFSCSSQQKNSSSDVTITDSTSNITVVNKNTNSNVVIDSSDTIKTNQNSVNIVGSGNSITIGEGNEIDGVTIKQGPSQTTVNGKQYKSKTGSLRIENNKVIIDGKVVDSIH